MSFKPGRLLRAQGGGDLENLAHFRNLELGTPEDCHTAELRLILPVIASANLLN